MGAGDERREDHGRDSRHSRFKPEHASVSAIVLALATAIVSIYSSQGVGSRIETHNAAREEQNKGLEKKLEATNEKLDALRLGLASISARGDSAKEAADRVVSELGRVSQELREVDKTAERVSTRLDDHERRIAALEGRNK